MAINIGGAKYVPGAYAKPRQSPAQMADFLIKDWEKRQLEAKSEKPAGGLFPTICFSRQIGVGALEIADLVGEHIGYRTVDREILEHIAAEADLNCKTVAFFDERYPGKLNEFLAMAFGEKSFIKSDYARHLFSAVISIASLEPTIFVGRGAHLLLPRNRVLAVRCICSRENRIKRLSGLLNVPAEEVDIKLEQIDKEQRKFFKEVYNKKDDAPSEFDLVINCDHILEPKWAAAIVEEAFKQKFGEEI